MMVRSLDDAGEVQITFDGVHYSVPKGVSVAAALLVITQETRLTKEGAPRGPHCMMGVCFECLVTIDGVANRQGCLVRVREGMVIARQRAV